MEKYHGLRVIDGSMREDKYKNLIGTINFDPNFLKEIVNEVLVVVFWDNGATMNHRIGYNQKYDLLVYDFTNKGAVHEGFHCDCHKDNNIMGTMWACLECRDTFMCNSCYIKNRMHIDHDICRIDSPNTMGCFVGRKSKLSKYIGMLKGSRIQNNGTFQTSFKGIIDSIDYDYTKNRLKIKAKFNDGSFKTYNDYSKLKLIEDGNTGDRNSVLIDLDQLRILGHNPIFNFQLFLHYNERIEEFASDFKYYKPDFSINDVVFIDCFSVLDLKDFQRGIGESNKEIENLIGKSGKVVHATDSVARVHYDSINKDVPINIKTLFNTKTSDQTIIRIISDSSVIKEEIEKWIIKIKDGSVKFDDKKWYPGEFIQNEIRGKVGVIILDGLPDNLVVVRFKKYQFPFGLLLPKSVCLNINELEDEIRNDVGCSINSISISLTDSEKEEFEDFKSIIESETFDDLQNKLNDMSTQMWSKLFSYAIEIKKYEILKMLLKNPKYDSSIVHKYLLERLSSRMTENMQDQLDIVLDVISDNIKLDFNHRTRDGDTVLHLAAKNNHYKFLSKILPENMDEINHTNKLTGFTAFHYAVENNNVDMATLLMDNNCNISVITKDKRTPLHIALQHYYLDVFIAIIAHHNSEEYVDVEITDNDENTILHLAASLPDNDSSKRWNSMLNSGGSNLLMDIIRDLQEFINKNDSKKNSNVTTESVFILSCLLLRKGQNACRVWHQNFNKKTETPFTIFNNSIKELKKGLEVDDANRLLELFRKYQRLNKNVAMCSFCDNDFATVTYKPCSHTLHCFHCSFMPYKCTECGENITGKVCGERKIKGFTELGEMAKNAIDITYPDTMDDWFPIIEKLLSERTCQSCKTKSCQFCLDCGHLICENCNLKCERCPICQNDKKGCTEIKSWSR